MHKLQFKTQQPSINIIEKQVRDALVLTITKVALHAKDPIGHPLPAGNDHLEYHIKKLYNKLNTAEKSKLVQTYGVVPDKSEQKRQQKWGKLAGIDLSTNIPVMHQAIAVLADQKFQFTKSEAADLEAGLHALAPRWKMSPKKPQPQQQGGGPRILRLSIEKVKCIDTQDIRKDEISVKGFTISSILENEPIEELSLGKFKVGDNIAVNKTLREFDLRETNVFPQTFLASLFVIERDTKKDDGTLNRTIDIASRAAIIAVLSGQLAAPFAIGAIIFAIPTLNVVALIIAITALALGLLIEIFGVIAPTLRLSEVSQELQDIFVFDLNTLGAGESISNTFNAKLIGTNALKLQGNYDVTFKWERVD